MPRSIPAPAPKGKPSAAVSRAAPQAASGDEIERDWDFTSQKYANLLGEHMSGLSISKAMCSLLLAFCSA